MKSANSNALRPKNWLLLKFRQWHTWAGLGAALFLVVISLTGIVLNYKKPIFQALGLETRVAADNKMAASAMAKSGGQCHAGNLAELPVNFPQALEIAQRELGEAPLERVELKHEQGEWLYKIKRQGGAEIWIAAATGANFKKGEYEKVRRLEAGTPVKSFDWGKLLLDLHTGKIGGPIGVAVMTGVAGLLFFLTLSGIYMWLKPVLIRRQNTAARAAAECSAVTVSANVLPQASKPQLTQAAPKRELVDA